VGGTDLTDSLRETVRAAGRRGTPLCLRGGGTRTFYGRAPAGDVLDLSGHRGIVRYQPTELVITARAGTPLAEVTAALAEHGQMLGFEPPAFGEDATLGGAIACGLGGPRRPFAGAARDAVLGLRCLDGTGEVLRFGGEVMKNVAGYDVPRLMTGALGTLGILLEISLKVLPRPGTELTLILEEPDPQRALERMAGWQRQPLPLSGLAWSSGRLWLRLEGTAEGVAAARARLGGEEPADGPAFWRGLRDHRLAFFSDERPLWRLAVPPAAPFIRLPETRPGDWLLDWGGAQRWLRSTLPPETVRAAATAAGGHATLFRGGDRGGEVFHPPSPAVLALHRRLKAVFDPGGIFNPGRLYPGV